jgi:SAM-dependent methyltransferase
VRAIVERRPLGDPGCEIPAKIPWDDRAFSGRMLDEHLSQEHDLASRRAETIDEHVAWILREALGGRPGRVLDVGCGPGLYTSRLARAGCTCLGIDFAPAAISYASGVAAAENLSCEYRLADARTADLGSGHDLAMMLYGELNTFTRPEAAELVCRMAASLTPGGRLVLEVTTEKTVRDTGALPPTWASTASGLFSADPHLVLTENAWVEESGEARTRYLILDARSGSVAVYGERVAAYREDDYVALVASAGLGEVAIHDGFGPTADTATLVITASKAACPAEGA